MPNWTENRIICKKHIGDKILTKNNDKYSFDFNTLIPMPKELQVEASTSGEKGLIYLFTKSNNELEKIEINNAYKSINPYFRDIYNDNFFDKINDNIKEYESNENFKIDLDLGKKYLDNYKKYGYCHWYSWCNRNWGTKWNVEEDVKVAYNKDSNEYEIRFYTAWSVPVGIVKKFKELCTDEEFYWEYKDEDSNERHILKKTNDEIIDTIFQTKDMDEMEY